MSAWSESLQLYLQIQCLLAVSYVLFRLTRGLFNRWSQFSSQRAFVVAGQALIALAIVLPIALGQVPLRHLPKIDLPKIQSFAGTDFGARGQLRKVRSMNRLMEEPVLAAPSRSAPTSRLFDPLEPRLWVISLGIAALLLLERLRRRARRVVAMIEEAVPIRSLGRISVRVSESAVVPFSSLLGGRASVVVPEDLLGRARDFRIAVRHELMHHRQGDTLWAIVVEVLRCAFFANPFVHLWAKEISELQEFSCDEALISRSRGRWAISPDEYASCLVRVAEAALGSRDVAVGTAGMASGSGNPVYFKSFLGRRIEMLVSHESSRGRSAAGIVLGTLVASFTALAAFGAQRSFRPSESAHPNPGTPSSDPEVQAIADKALERVLNDRRAKAGFVVVSDPFTGKLLAVANRLRGEQDDSGYSGKSWALSYQIEPASLIKTILVGAAVETAKTTLDEKYDCENGSYSLGGEVYHDWKPFHHQTTAGTLIHSSNICGIKIAQKLGAAGVYRALTEFGFGPGGTSEGFASAMPGRYPLPEQLPENRYVPLIATGYSGKNSFSVTPLEVVQAYGAIANGGHLMKPLRIEDPDSAAVEVRRVLTPENADQMKQVLARVMTEGTATSDSSAFYTTAGKTSTAYHPQLPDHQLLGGERSVSAFVGFAPVSKPRVVIYAAIIEPEGDQPNGSRMAGPLFREVAERVLRHWGVELDEPRP